MSIYLQDKSEFMNFLFEGPLPINEEIETKLAEHIKTTLPCPAYFDSIVSIEIDFTYNFEQLYKVTYKATRFYNQDKQPWQGNSSKDDSHQIAVVTELIAKLKVPANKVFITFSTNKVFNFLFKWIK